MMYIYIYIYTSVDPPHTGADLRWCDLCELEKFEKTSLYSFMSKYHDQVS